MKAAPFGRDCLAVAEEYLLGEKWADAKTLEAWRKEMIEKVEETVAAPPDISILSALELKTHKRRKRSRAGRVNAAVASPTGAVE